MNIAFTPAASQRKVPGRAPGKEKGGKGKEVLEESFSGRGVLDLGYGEGLGYERFGLWGRYGLWGRIWVMGKVWVMGKIWVEKKVWGDLDTRDVTEKDSKERGKG